MLKIGSLVLRLIARTQNANTTTGYTIRSFRFMWTGYRKEAKVAKYFSDDEVKGLEPKLVEMLDQARESAGVPIIITSGWRSPESNDSAGGVKDSAHTTGKAVDVRAPNDEYGKQVAFGLGHAGFQRAGFYDKHIHVDIDDTKPTPAKWKGESH